MLISRKELFYYIFFVLMIAAKGLGMDSGDKMYYIFSSLAAAAVTAKLIVTRYNKKEIIAMGIICLIAVLAYKNSGRLGIVLSILAVIGMKDMDVKKLFRIGLVVFGAAFAVKVSAAAAGVIPNALTVHEKGGIGEIIRWGMGFSTGNVFHESYFILTAFIVYNMGKRYGLKQLLWLMLGNLLVFVFSFSYTGIIVTTFYLLLSLYAVKRNHLSRMERILAQAPLPLCLLCSFVTPFMLGTPLGDKLNLLLQARPAFSHYFLTQQPITLFGTRMTNIPNFWIIMDNGYVYFLMTFGIAAFVIFCIGYVVTIGKYSKILAWGERNTDIANDKNNGSICYYNKELAMIYAFLLYGIMEQFISNAFMNISLFFVGEVFFAVWNPGNNEQEANINLLKSKIIEKTIQWGEKTAVLSKIVVQAKKSAAKICIIVRKQTAEKRYYIYAAGIAAGAIFLTGYLAAGKKAEYVTVPITAVNQIEACSVVFQLETAYEEKDDLKQEMKEYKRIIEDEAFLKRSLLYAEEKNKEYFHQIKWDMNSLTAEEIRNIIQVSIPQQNQENKIYNAFRLRLLVSYYDVPVKVYQAVLEGIVIGLQEREGMKNNASASGIYQETIGKSFGTERIEHIENKEKYFVEKSGNVAAVENVRSGIVRTLAGGILGSAFAVIAGFLCFIKDRMKESKDI